MEATTEEAKLQSRAYQVLVLANTMLREHKRRLWDLQVTAATTEYEFGHLGHDQVPNDIAADGDTFPSWLSAIQEEIARLEGGTQGLEAFQDEARQTHANVSRGKIRSLNILDLPDKTLINIFEYVQGGWPEYSYGCHFSNHGPQNDINSVKSLRLTCHRFCRMSGHLLLYFLDVQMNAASLAHLDQVSRHPTISKGIRALRIRTEYYSAAIAKSLGLFFSLASENLDRQLQEAEMSFEMFGTCGLNDNEVQVKLALEEGRRVTESWIELAGHFENGTLPPEHAIDNPEHESGVVAIRRAHAKYSELYYEQEMVLRNGTFTQTIADAMARMPTAVRLCVMDRELARDDELSQFIDLIDDSDAYLQQQIVRPCLWNVSRDLAENAPTDLLFLLPLAISAAGVSLTAMEVSVTSLLDFPYDITGEKMRDLEIACQHLKSFVFRIGTQDWSDGASYADHDITSICNFLSACTATSKRIERLELKFETGSMASQGFFLADRPWPVLGMSQFALVSIHLDELRAFLGSIGPYREPRLDFDGVRLLSGTWAEALDIIRGTVVSDLSEVNDSRGAEVEDMSQEDVDMIFGRSAADIGGPNQAFEYITQEREQNPFMDLQGATAS